MYLGLIVFTYTHKVPGSKEGGREKRGEAERVCGYMHFRFETPTASTFPAAPSLVGERTNHHQIKKERAFSKGLKREQAQPVYAKGQRSVSKDVYKTDHNVSKKAACRREGDNLVCSSDASLILGGSQT